MKPVSDWPAALEATLAQSCKVFSTVRVFAETASTQDAARDFAERPGHVVVAARQTRGRGRLGRSWSDTGNEGIAVTFCAPSVEPERLVLASSVAVALAIEDACELAVGIKWPNDLIVRGRKLGGVLIERAALVALIGIGINVGQREFGPELAQSATSLLLEGVDLDRLDLLCRLVTALDLALREPIDSLLHQYVARDSLRGCEATFRTPGGDVTGRVVRAHPIEGLAVDTSTGSVLLPTSTTSVLAWHSPDRLGSR